MAEKKETVEDLEAKIKRIKDKEAKVIKAKANAAEKRNAIAKAGNKAIARKAQLERLKVAQAEKYLPLVAKSVKAGFGTDVQKKLIDLICELQDTGELSCDCKVTQTIEKD